MLLFYPKSNQVLDVRAGAVLDVAHPNSTGAWESVLPVRLLAWTDPPFQPGTGLRPGGPAPALVLGLSAARAVLFCAPLLDSAILVTVQTSGQLGSGGPMVLGCILASGNPLRL
jgi:hypothetical protein